MKEGGWKGVTVGECLESGGVGLGEAGWYRIAENETEKRQREERDGDEVVNSGGDPGHGGRDGKGSNAVRRWEVWRWWVWVVAVMVSWAVIGI